MKVVITGAGGFVGGWVARWLANQGHEVCGLYRNHIAEETRQTPGVSLLQLDLASGVALPGSCDALIHCAADIPGLCADPEKLVRSNVEGAERVFAAAKAAGAQTIINLSSMSVYGTISVAEVTEDLLPDSPDVYGQSKIEAERMLDELCRNRAIQSGLSIRLPGTVGRGSHHNFLSDVMERIVAGQPVELRNPDTLFNNIVFVGDLAQFMDQWLRHPKTGHSVTNLAAEAPWPIGEVANAMYSHAGRTPHISIKTGGKKPFLISLEHARSLGYAPSTVQASVEAFVNDYIG